ncbi:uncharacterized protein A4U43_C08F20980 [Asparagus officinalis]|nr:uncharacterized protein A4U43_C08F20980 [Asparagus officinalis]
MQELLEDPLFLSLHNLCATLKCTVPSDAMFLCAVTKAGYRISGTHTTPIGFKTDAPMIVIWDILRCWVKKLPVRAQLSGRSGTEILSKEPTFQAKFSPPVIEA